MCKKKVKKLSKTVFIVQKNTFIHRLPTFVTKKSFFLPHLLHISKKSSNFAAGFNKKTLCQR